jgi:predicted nucleic acid-binding protein
LNGYLLDTDVLSMLAPSRTDASTGVLDWLERRDGEGRIFLSAVTVHEIEKGIALLEHKQAKAKAKVLKKWIGGLLSAYEDKIIAIDAHIATLSGGLEAKAIAGGHHPGMADALIAGTAEAHSLVVLSGNTRHFLPFGVAVLTPAEAAASAKGTRS